MNSGGTGWTPVTARVFCAVSAVSAVVPCTPAWANAFRSAWIPAPPPESDPAIERHTGTRSAMKPMIGREYDRLRDVRGRDPLHDERRRNEHRLEKHWRRRRDIVWLGGFVGHLEYILEQPLVQRFFDRLGAFARVVAFDKRGQGLSDRPDRAATMEEHAEDALAVMDAAGIERPTLVGVSEGGPAAIVFAAAHPDRIGKLVLYGTYARLLRDDDYPDGATLAGLDRIRERALTDWGDPVALARLRPVDGRRPRVRRMVGAAAAPRGQPVRHASAAGHLGAPRRSRRAAARPRAHARDVPQHGPDDAVRVWTQYLADHIEGARIADLGPGDHLFFTGDTEPMLRELHDFVTGTPGGPVPEDVLATVVFTDIVGSTERAAELGDAEWHRVLARHDDLVRGRARPLARSRGQAARRRVPGVLRGPGARDPLRTGHRRGVRQLGLEIRAGIHTGECERRGDDLAGMAVHIGARVGAAADAGEILVSGTVRDLVVGSGIEFADRGAQELKGVPGEWRLYAVA